ncbi:MAG TPA: peptidoglycan-binding protein [Herpetosiphonaceae bacterium]
MFRSARSSRHRLSATALTLLFVLMALLGTAIPAAALASWPTVREGDTGSNVKAVQYLLRQHGSGIAADGVFGPATKSAVISFQQSRGLTADGIVGSQTWSALIVTVREGSSGEAVKAAQTLLVKNGHNIAVDGAFGPATKSAVVSFQSAHGLSADGIVGPMTWQELAGSGNGSTTWRTARASAYGPGLWGRTTACGQTLYTTTIGVAHRTMACGTRLKFQGRSGQIVYANVIDRGPYVSDREFDLTEATVKQMGYASASDFGVRTVYWNYN